MTKQTQKTLGIITENVRKALTDRIAADGLTLTDRLGLDKVYAVKAQGRGFKVEIPGMEDHRTPKNDKQLGKLTDAIIKAGLFRGALAKPGTNGVAAVNPNPATVAQPAARTVEATEVIAAGEWLPFSRLPHDARLGLTAESITVTIPHATLDTLRRVVEFLRTL